MICTYAELGPGTICPRDMQEHTQSSGFTCNTNELFIAEGVVELPVRLCALTYLRTWEKRTTVKLNDPPPPPPALQRKHYDQRSVITSTKETFPYRVVVRVP